MLFGATGTGRDLAGAIATHLPTGLTADTTELDVRAASVAAVACQPAGLFREDDGDDLLQAVSAADGYSAGGRFPGAAA